MKGGSDGFKKQVISGCESFGKIMLFLFLFDE
jgi:hypothetical protein